MNKHIHIRFYCIILVPINESIYSNSSFVTKVTFVALKPILSNYLCIKNPICTYCIIYIHVSGHFLSHLLSKRKFVKIIGFSQLKPNFRVLACYSFKKKSYSLHLIVYLGFRNRSMTKIYIFRLKCLN